MPCFHPLAAMKPPSGRLIFNGTCPAGSVPLHVPCGRCIGCRLDRSRQWACRLLHEAQVRDASSFITLTYRELSASSCSLNYSDFQLFMKRLRQAVRPVRLSFFMCGEYGEENFRPHFHALIFGHRFDDRSYLRKLPSGFRIFRSAQLERLWPQGISSVGDVTFESAAYVARYACKSVLGDGVPGKRQSVKLGFVDRETGEFVPFVPEFNRMSLRPAIGKDWFRQWGGDVFPHDYVVVRGQKVKPPRYYLKLLESADPVSAEFVRFARQARLEAEAVDSTPARLLVREAVAKARLSFKKRGFK